MGSVRATARIKADVSDIWALWTDPDRLATWLPVTSETGPLVAGEPFSWLAAAPFEIPLHITGRAVRLDAGRALELDVDLRLAPQPSRLVVELVGAPGGGTTEVVVLHDRLPDDDLGLFETNGYGHYWNQHLESLRDRAERVAPTHHHPLHTGVHFTGGHPALGLLVGGVMLGSPVHEAGIHAGDVLQEVDGTPVRTIVGFDEWLDGAVPETTVPFSLARGRVPVRLPAKHD